MLATVAGKKNEPVQYELKLIKEFVNGPGTDDIEYTRYGITSLAMLKDGLGSIIALTGPEAQTIAQIGYDAWGEFMWSGEDEGAPCTVDQLGSYLEKIQNTRNFGSTAHNGWNFGRHFASELSPHLYTGRRFSDFTGQYWHRNRYYSPALGRFTTKDPIGFNGGMNLYRYADNNPIIYTDPMGLSACYKDLVVRVLNYYDSAPFSYGKAILNTGFNFFKTIQDGPKIMVYDFNKPGQKDKLGTVGTWPWTERTKEVFENFSLPSNSDEFIANIVIAETNWGNEFGNTAGQTDRTGKNQALVSGKYYAHLDPIKLGWTVTHETGHILIGLAENSYSVGSALMTPGSWDSTEFIEENQQKILDALAK